MFKENKSKRRLKIHLYFLLTLFISISISPMLIDAHNENHCPVHTHHEIVSTKYGLCSPGYVWWKDANGCWNREYCLGLYSRHARWCTHGQWTLCSGCNELTKQCNGHLVTCTGIALIGDCGGHKGNVSWYTCQHDSCPYGPSSS